MSPYDPSEPLEYEMGDPSRQPRVKWRDTCEELKRDYEERMAFIGPLAPIDTSTAQGRFLVSALELGPLVVEDPD